MVNWKRGFGLVVGIFELILAIIAILVIVCCAFDVIEDLAHLKEPLWRLLVVGLAVVALLVAIVLLLFGILTYEESFMLPWFVYHLIDLLILTGAQIYYFFAFDFDIAVADFIGTWLVSAIQVIVMFIMWLLYEEIKIENEFVYE